MAKESIPQLSLFDQALTSIALHRNAKDISGQRFGMLVALRPVSSGRRGVYWECLCDCGVRRVVYAARLKSGETRSCGHPIKASTTERLSILTPDLAGQRFGRLLALRISNHRTPGGRIQWECLCDCGTTKAVSAQCLRRGTQSCGCLVKENSGENLKGKPKPSRDLTENAGRKRLLRSYRLSARARGLTWQLTDDQAIALFKADCHYCGLAPQQVSHGGETFAPTFFVYNGIDRLDSRQGYLAGNVVSCCRHCNMAKRDVPADEFVSWIERAYRHLFRAVLIPE